RKPEVTATAEEFVKAALADPQAAEARLKGKVVELTGQVSGADPHYYPKGISLSAGKRKPTDSFGVFADCEVRPAGRDKAWLLATKQKVKVVGVLQAVENDRVRLADCTVTELEPNPIPSVKAADLAAAYARDESAASTKYGGRYNHKELFLEGAVVAT